MSDRWDFFFTTIEDHKASIFVDMGIHDDVPDPNRTSLYTFRIPMLRPRNDGLSNGDEANVLFDIEDVLRGEIAKRFDGLPVGRMTWNGVREFFYYGPPNRDVTDVVRVLSSKFPDYTAIHAEQPDSEWRHYFEFLYPSPEEHETIKNLHVLEAMSKHDDDHTMPREVDHWAYFPTAVAREQFSTEAIRREFEMKPYDEVTPRSEMPFGVHLVKRHAIDWNTINDETLSLFRLAKQFDGTYDGWGAKVERNES